MSTKIYEAYRIPASQFSEFLFFIYKETIDKFVSKAENLIGRIDKYSLEKMMQRYSVKEEAKQEANWPEHKRWLKWEFLRDAFREHAHTDNYLFDVQSGWVFYPNGRYFYGWPWGDTKLDEETVLKFEDAEDFSYWDDTDKPEEISTREWRRRGIKWDEILLHQRERKLTFYTIDFSKDAYQTAWSIEKSLGFWNNKENST